MRKLLVIPATIGLVLMSASVGWAQTPPDPTNGQFDSGVSGLQSFITGVVSGPLFLLTVAVLGIVVGLSWLKKRGKQSAT